MIIRKRNPVNIITLIIFIYLNIAGLFSSDIMAATGMSSYTLITLLYLSAFLLPTVCLAFVQRKKFRVTQYLKLKSLRWRFVPLIICLSVSATFFCVLLNSLIVSILGRTFSENFQTPAGPINFENGWLVFLTVILMPALFEELYFRGAYISQYGKRPRFEVIMASSLLFAMLHASLDNFISPLILGVVYAVLIYVTGSVFAAVLAHIINNSIITAVLFYSDAINKSGLKNLMLIVILIMFLVFFYLSLKFFEPHYEKISKIDLKTGEKRKLTVKESRSRRLQRISPWTPAFFATAGVWAVKIIFILTDFWG